MQMEVLSCSVLFYRHVQLPESYDVTYAAVAAKQHAKAAWEAVEGSKPASPSSAPSSLAKVKQLQAQNGKSRPVYEVTVGIEFNLIVRFNPWFLEQNGLIFPGGFHDRGPDPDHERPTRATRCSWCPRCCLTPRCCLAEQSDGLRWPRMVKWGSLVLLERKQNLTT